MNGPLMTLLCTALVALGVLAEVNLIRLFISECREDPPRTRRSRRVPMHRDVQPPLSGPWRRCLAACFAAPLLTTPAYAQDSTGQPAAPAPTPAAAPSPDEAKSPFSLQLNLDYTTAYFYRGIIQEDSGLILQPAAKLTVNLIDDADGWKLDAFVGTWNSFHGQATAAQTHGDFTEYWYESDLYAGLAAARGRWSLTTSYIFLTSPSDAYETVQELNLTLAFDDSDLLDKWAMHPYALLAIETGADASDGAQSDTGTYLELGVAPGFSFDVGETPVSITFPASVGLSLDNYYQNSDGDDDTFGFAQVGVKAAIPLPWGSRYGSWTLNGGVAALFLGDHTSEFNADDETEVIATIGLQVNF